MSPSETEDLHVVVLEAAFKLMSSGGNQVRLSGRDNKTVSFPRDLLVLFSPLLRSLLTDLPCTSKLSDPVLILPEASSTNLFRLQDLLMFGRSQDPLGLQESRDLLDTCQLLGLNIKDLHLVGREAAKTGEAAVNEVTVNLDSVASREAEIRAIIRQRRQEGNQIVLTKSVQKQQTYLAAISSGPTPVNKAKTTKDLAPKAPMVAIKKENVLPPNGGEGVPAKPSSEEKMETEPPSHSQASSISTVRRAKFPCEKCKKVQETALLLKYHYCSHYMDILRKRYDGTEDSKKNICFICKKTHPNSRRLLLHIGVNHNKINDILQMKGFSPVLSSTEKPEVTMTKVAENVAPLTDKRSFDIRSVMDRQAVTSPPPPPPSTPGSSRPAETKSGEKMSLDAECNFNLECQVCKQKLSSFHMLEQHCCRHFMKELAEQFSGIMENMKCGLCNSTFKQKHSLLLHIGCKHGKINDILRQKGYVVLPAPIVNSNNGSLQKQMQSRLIEIKKERLTEDDDVITKESKSSLKKEAGEDSMNQVETPGPHAFKLSEVLTKFSVPSI